MWSSHEACSIHEKALVKLESVSQARSISSWFAVSGGGSGAMLSSANRLMANSACAWICMALGLLSM